MSYNDIVGTIGVGIILIAYFMNIFSFIKKDGVLFYVMNIIGASLACYASILINYLPFIILEATWTMVSVLGLVKVLRKNG
jgi:hypothetical protein